MGNGTLSPGLIRASVVARMPKYLYPASLWSVDKMCRDGVFKTAVKLTAGRKSHWYIHSTEVINFKLNRNVKTD